MNTNEIRIFLLKSYILNLPLLLPRWVGAALGARLVRDDGAFAFRACRHVRFLHG